MNAASNALVSVVIPAYNAERTIDETLTSVRGQTHADLDIIMVDDGSSDDTMRIAAKHAEADARVRLITQKNGGVAAARNRGIEEARGAVVAPVDADDLWLPTKIERQMRCMAAGDRIGLVYTYSMLIDEKSRIIGTSASTSHSGDVLRQMAYVNFIGNGSSALIRKDLLVAAGGFDPSLRARKAQGCEDWKLFFQIARSSHFAVVPDFLTGYRQMAGAMSRNYVQMLRSDAIVRAEILDLYPEFVREVFWGRKYYVSWLLGEELQLGDWAQCAYLRAQLADQPEHPLRAAVSRAKLMGRFVKWRFKHRPKLFTDKMHYLPQPAEVRERLSGKMTIGVED